MSSMRDDLIALCDQLRQVFADERSAIGALDHARLAEVAARKHELVGQLHARRDAITDPGVRDVLVTVRDEARATAMLAITANTAVRILLGYEVAPAYDRRARPVSQTTSKILAAY